MVSDRPFFVNRNGTALISCEVRETEDLSGKSERIYIHSIVMRRITTFRSATDHVYDGGPIRFCYYYYYYYYYYYLFTYLLTHSMEQSPS